MRQPPVQKVEIKLTVLMRAESPEAARDELEGTEIEEIAEMITAGDAIGGLSITSASTVPKKDVESELVDIGNDGSFFDDGLDDEDEPEDDEGEDER